MADDDIVAMMAMPGDYQRFYALCEPCKAVFGCSTLVKTLAGEEETHKWHPGFDSLRNSVAEACHFCSLVLAGLRKESKLGEAEASQRPLSLIIKGSVILKSTFERSRSGDALRVGNLLGIKVSPDSEPFNQEPSKQDSLLELHVKNTFSSFEHWTPINHAVYKDRTDSAEHVALATQFIANCEERHPAFISSCNWSLKFVPKRLIRLDGTGDSLKVTLYHTSESDTGVKYCCLSHCWGKGQPLSLKKSNLRDFERDISLSDIPKLYRDAMQIAQSIGVNYMWIDSLCIIQDSIEDWNEQAAKMASIYTNSYCTIAAADASDSSESAYASRNTLEFMPCRIAGSNMSDSLFAYYRGLPSCNIDYLQRNSPLFSRAWIFQERLLSPRVLYFSKWGLAFNCRCAFASETDTLGQAYPLQPTGRKQFQLWEDGISDLEWIRCVELRDEYYIDNADLHDTWWQLVGEYTLLQMTRPSDKLVALSGVAQVIWSAQDFPMDYLAGLWQPTLIRDLLWYVYTSHAPRPAQFRAPSWSWAAVEGRVFSYDKTYRNGWHTGRNEMASFVDAEIETNKADTRKMGRVVRSYLKMKGKLKLAPALEEKDGAGCSSAVYATKEAIIFDGNVEGKVFIDVVDEKKDVAYLLPLKRIPQVNRDGDPEAERLCEIRGLLLHKASEGYRRVGIFVVSRIPFAYFDDCDEQEVVFRDGEEAP